MFLFVSSRRARMQGDQGMGLVLVMGVIAFVTAVALTATAYAINSLKQSTNRSNNEVSLSTAENGVDFAMAKLQAAYTSYNADLPIPSNTATTADPSPYCNAAKVSFPATLGGTVVSDADGSFLATGTTPAEVNERTWARQQLEALVGVTGCKKKGGNGEFVVLKPVSAFPSGQAPKAGKIYSLSAVPSFTNPQRTRLVKSEYIFSPYRPTNAILTGGNLQFQGNLTVTTAYGFDPTLAQVHSNGSIDVIGNAASVTGAVSSTGSSSASISGHAITTTPVQSIPNVSAREFYTKAPATDPAAMARWTDLCDDGHAYPWSANGPCDTSQTALDNNGSYNNWSYSTSAAGDKTWTANPGVVHGTYFAYQTNVKNGTGNSSISDLSVIAASKNPDNCSSKKYGNIAWDHYDIGTPSFKGLWFYADGDVAVTANIKIGSGNTAPPVLSGMIISGDQSKIYTQSNSAVGAVVAADKCVATQPGDSLISLDEVHSDLYYDPNLVGPFTSIITNTLWLDYSS